jgi:uncharacterized protein YhbP (UPF0306 family)
MNTTNVLSDIKQYIKDIWLMQIATSLDNQPWIANVYFVADENLNFYWLSTPARRHSRELSINHKAAIAIVIKKDQPVIGIQAEGSVEQEHSLKKISEIMPIYIKKYGSGKDFLRLVKAAKNDHVMYRFTPEYLQLFDEQNYSPKENPIQFYFD